MVGISCLTPNVVSWHQLPDMCKYFWGMRGVYPLGFPAGSIYSYLSSTSSLNRILPIHYIQISYPAPIFGGARVLPTRVGVTRAELRHIQFAFQALFGRGD